MFVHTLGEECCVVSGKPFRGTETKGLERSIMMREIQKDEVSRKLDTWASKMHHHTHPYNERLVIMSCSLMVGHVCLSFSYDLMFLWYFLYMFSASPGFTSNFHWISIGKPMRMKRLNLGKTVLSAFYRAVLPVTESPSPSDLGMGLERQRRGCYLLV